MVIKTKYNIEHFSDGSLKIIKKDIKKILEKFGNTLSTSGPSFLGIGTDNLLYIKSDMNTEWIQIPNSGSVKSAIQINDGTFVGIGTDNKLYTRANINDVWFQVPNSGDVINIIQLQDNTYIGIGSDNKLYTRPTLIGSWTGPVDTSMSVRSIAQLADKTFVGVGIDNLLYTKVSLSAAWILVPNSGNVKNIIQLPTNTFIGIGLDNKLYTRYGLNNNSDGSTPATWNPITNSNYNIINIANYKQTGGDVQQSNKATASDYWNAIKPYLIRFVNTPNAVRNVLIGFGVLFLMFVIMMILFIFLVKQ